MLLPESIIPSKLEPTVIVTLSGLLTKPYLFVTTSSNANVCWNMVRGAVKIQFTAVELLRVTPSPFDRVHW